MNRLELEKWLCGRDERVPPPAEIAAVLGVSFDSIADTTLLRAAERLRAVRFTIAVLRDVFTDDVAVRAWLRVPREELGGPSGLELLFAGRTRAVEDLAMREWHRPASVAPDEGALIRATA